MYFKPTGPLTMGGVLAASWRLYRLSFRYCRLLALPAALPAALLMLTVARWTRALTSVWTDAMLNINVRALYARGIPFARAIGEPALASALLWALLLAAMMVTPLALAAGEPAVGAISALGVATRRLHWIALGVALTLLMTFGGLALLLFPGLFWWGRVQLWLVPVLAERASAPGAIGRSWALTRGHWWRVSTLLCIAVAVVCLGSACGVWIGAALGGLVAPALRAGVAPAWLLATLIGTASLVLTLPYLAAMLVVVYDDLEMHAMLATARMAQR
jgi:hypothetical protein